MSKFLYKTITEYYKDGQELVIGADKLYDYVSHRVVSKDDDDTYLAGNMLPDLKFIKVTEKY